VSSFTAAIIKIYTHRQSVPNSVFYCTLQRSSVSHGTLILIYSSVLYGRLKCSSLSDGTLCISVFYDSLECIHDTSNHVHHLFCVFHSR